MAEDEDFILFMKKQFDLLNQKIDSLKTEWNIVKTQRIMGTSKVAETSQKMVQGQEGGFEDPRKALLKLIQIGSVSEYQAMFEKLMNRVTEFSETLLISFFVSGLKLRIQIELLKSKPKTLGEAFSLAQIYEAKDAVNKFQVDEETVHAEIGVYSEVFVEGDNKAIVEKDLIPKLEKNEELEVLLDVNKTDVIEASEAKAKIYVQADCCEDIKNLNDGSLISIELTMADMNFEHEVNNEIPKFIDVCEIMDRNFANKIFVAHNPYGLRLLLMGRSECVDLPRNIRNDVVVQTFRDADNQFRLPLDDSKAVNSILDLNLLHGDFFIVNDPYQFRLLVMGWRTYGIEIKRITLVTDLTNGMLHGDIMDLDRKGYGGLVRDGEMVKKSVQGSFVELLVESEGAANTSTHKDTAYWEVDRVPGLFTFDISIIDYSGYRVVAQSILLGILQLDNSYFTWVDTSIDVGTNKDYTCYFPEVYDATSMPLKKVGEKNIIFFAHDGGTCLIRLWLTTTGNVINNVKDTINCVVGCGVRLLFSLVREFPTNWGQNCSCNCSNYGLGVFTTTLHLERIRKDLYHRRPIGKPLVICDVCLQLRGKKLESQVFVQWKGCHLENASYIYPKLYCCEYDYDVIYTNYIVTLGTIVSLAFVSKFCLDNHIEYKVVWLPIYSENLQLDLTLVTCKVVIEALTIPYLTIQPSLLPYRDKTIITSKMTTWQDAEKTFPLAVQTGSKMLLATKVLCWMFSYLILEDKDVFKGCGVIHHGRQ